MRVVIAACCALALPGLVSGQDAEVRADVDSILGSSWVDVSPGSLEQRFVTNIFFLLPDLSAEDQEVVFSAAAEAFHPATFRADLTESLARTVPVQVVEKTLELQRNGAQAELSRLAASYEPPLSLEDFTADPSRLDRQRLQLMASLAEARRQSGSDLAVDELLRQIAHEVAVALGAEPGAFAPLSGDVFESAYRDRTIRLAIEALHEYETVSTELLETVIEEYASDESRTFLDHYGEALLFVVAAAGQRFADLAFDAPPESGAEVVGPGEGVLCQVEVCGLLVEWQGTEPSNTQGYGIQGDFERYLRLNLSSAGYQFTRRAMDGELTIRFRARPERVVCEVVSGTDNRVCQSLGQVQVDFMGRSEVAETPNGFLVRNRCGAEDYLLAIGMAELVADRLHYEITTFEGDERRVPSC